MQRGQKYNTTYIVHVQINKRLSCVDPFGQHGSDRLPQPTGRGAVAVAQPTGGDNTPMGVSPPIIPSGSPRARSPQLRSRPAFTGRTQPEGMVPPSPGCSADLGKVRPRPRRYLRIAARHTLTPLVLHSRGRASSGSGRVRVTVAGGEPLRVPPLLPDQSGSRQGQETTLSTDPGGPPVAQTRLV